MNLTRKELGEMCGMSEENIVRLLKNFREENIIEINGKKIDFLNKSLLTRMSENG
jgi:CRP/FNR family transcriptional regulator